MSFSVVTKDELARVMPKKDCCRLAELSALVKMDGSIEISGRHRLALNITTENAAAARKIVILIKELFALNTQVLVRRKIRLKKNNIYLVRIGSQPGIKDILVRMGMLDKNGQFTERVHSEIISRQCCRKSYLRGAFLGGGSVNKPEGDYHLEIITDKKQHARDIAGVMQTFDLPARISIRKNWYVVYLKDSEQIITCLNIMGAHTALLEFENVRIFKDMRNQVNRLVNCETANLNKTIDAAVRQLENIKFIAGTVGLAKLPESLRQTAELRLQNPDASLRELGEMLQPRVGKSCVNHRLRKLEKMAQKLRDGKSNDYK
ncbi:DNA-binding protein WhiA [Desulfolucanica intricata]|uniref:DNA-binding protein WhiA n=1 Tax=Desulfolucanica intricata TaxID=1285191 RepID=UPI000837A55E|nr:DNA-binding protein WhiA [Desulfolucanica intricata]